MDDDKKNESDYVATKRAENLDRYLGFKVDDYGVTVGWQR